MPQLCHWRKNRIWTPAFDLALIQQYAFEKPSMRVSWEPLPKSHEDKQRVFGTQSLYVYDDVRGFLFCHFATRHINIEPQHTFPMHDGRSRVKRLMHGWMSSSCRNKNQYDSMRWCYLVVLLIYWRLHDRRKHGVETNTLIRIKASGKCTYQRLRMIIVWA